MLFITNFVQPQQVRYEGFGEFKIGGQIIRTVKRANDLVPPAVKETVLQGMT
jgi:hypothetical protein